LDELEQFRRNGRLLEIGCGYGFFLEEARKRGWHVEGVEVSGYASDMARRRGLAVHTGTVEESPLAAAADRFDAVLLWDVIEHLLFPDSMLADCARLLRHGGLLALRTPDARALTPSLWPLRASYRHFVYPVNTAEHVFHFTPEQLRQLVTASGFKDVSTETEETWEARVISGNQAIVRAARWVLMRYSVARRWPYEFTLRGVKP